MGGPGWCWGNGSKQEELGQVLEPSFTRPALLSVMWLSLTSLCCDILTWSTASPASRKQLSNHQSFPRFIHSSVYRVLTLVGFRAPVNHQLSMLQHSDRIGKRQRSLILTAHLLLCFHVLPTRPAADVHQLPAAEWLNMTAAVLLTGPARVCSTDFSIKLKGCTVSQSHLDKFFISLTSEPHIKYITRTFFHPPNLAMWKKKTYPPQM